MTEIGYMVNDERAPITSRLNAAREQLQRDLQKAQDEAPRTVEGMLHAHAVVLAGVFDLFADVIVAVHQLEVGDLPEVEIR